MRGNRGISFLILAAAGLCAAQSPSSISPYPAANFTMIQGPWDGLGVQTIPSFINDKGDILGTYLDAGHVPHGFVILHDCDKVDEKTSDRECGVTFTLDAPNAGTDERGGTTLIGADKNGTILGSWADDSGERHGALWWPQCTETACTLNFESFDAPGAGTQDAFPPTGTYPSAIGPDGAIAGNYYDASYGTHAFYATQQRIPYDSSSPITLQFSLVLVPGYSAVYPHAVNSRGEMIGAACNGATCVGYLRSPRGAVTVPGGQPAGYVDPDGINSSGEVIGIITTSNPASQFFLYQPNGNVTLLDFEPQAIDDRGLIAGSGFIVTPEGEAFDLTLRAPDGAEVGFSPPVAEFDVGVSAMNNKGWIIGVYEDTEYLYQGFVWKP